MSHYVFAPAGDYSARTDLVLRCVEFIGQCQPGYGSNYSKGKRYLKSQIPKCSGKAIKRAVKVCSKVINNDFDIYGLDTYFYHVDLCDIIIKEIIDFLKRRSVEEKEELLGSAPNDGEYLDLLYKHRIEQLKWVEIEDYKKQGGKAEELLERFRAL